MLLTIPCYSISTSRGVLGGSLGNIPGNGFDDDDSSDEEDSVDHVVRSECKNTARCMHSLIHCMLLVVRVKAFVRVNDTTGCTLLCRLPFLLCRNIPTRERSFRLISTH